MFLAFNEAYKYSNDIKYKNSMDSYFNFVFDALENKSGTFSFNKDGVDYILPYEKIGEVGLNQDNYDNTYKETNDFTTDQLFYTVLGIVSYDKNNYYSKEFLKAIKRISLDNSKFYGEYTINGDKGSNEETVVESVNTGFYLMLLEMYSSDVNEISNINNIALSKKLVSMDKNVNGAYIWNFDSDNPHVVETLATAVLLKSIYKSVVYVNNNTIKEELIDNPIQEEKVVLNPNTGSFINYLIVVVCTIVSLLVIFNVIRKSKFYKL